MSVLGVVLVNGCFEQFSSVQNFVKLVGSVSAPKRLNSLGNTVLVTLFAKQGNAH